MARGVDHFRNAESALADAAAILPDCEGSDPLGRANALLALAAVHAQLAHIALVFEGTKPGIIGDDEWKEELTGDFY